MLLYEYTGILSDGSGKIIGWRSGLGRAAVPWRIMLGRDRLGEFGLSYDGGAAHVYQLHSDHQGGAGGILRG